MKLILNVSLLESEKKSGIVFSLVGYIRSRVLFLKTSQLTQFLTLTVGKKTEYTNCSDLKAWAFFTSIRKGLMSCFSRSCLVSLTVD